MSNELNKFTDKTITPIISLSGKMHNTAMIRRSVQSVIIHFQVALHVPCRNLNVSLHNPRTHHNVSYPANLINNRVFTKSPQYMNAN